MHSHIPKQLPWLKLKITLFNNEVRLKMNFLPLKIKFYSMKLIERDTPERKKTIVTAIAKMFKSQKADFTKHGFDSN